MAQIYGYNGTTPVKPKAINAYNNGWLYKKKGYVYNNGQWQPIISYGEALYTKSLGLPYIPGYTGTSDDWYSTISRGNITWGTSYITMTVRPNDDRDGQVFITTKTLVDLTKFTSLKFNLSTPSWPETVKYQISNPDGILIMSGTLPWPAQGGGIETSTINISGLSGLHNIRLMVEALNSSGWWDLYVHDIWLE